MRKKVVIWGASGHSLVVADILRLRGEYEIVGLLDDMNPARHGQSLSALTILGGREKFAALRRDGVTHLIFGFGDCVARQELTPVVEENGFEFATAIHPRAIMAADVIVGSGTVVVAGAVVNPAVRIGRNCIINTCASVDHECFLGDAVHLGPGGRLAGRVRVDDAAWIGIGATVLDGRQIGRGSVVGAGAVVTKSIPEGVVAYGVPAKIIRSLSDENHTLTIPLATRAQLMTQVPGCSNTSE